MNNVKRILAVLLVSMLLIGGVLAAGGSSQAAGNENATSGNSGQGECGGTPITAEELRGSCADDDTMTQSQIRAVLQEQMTLREQQLDQFMVNNTDSCDKETVRRQNTVRLAVYTIFVYGALDEEYGDEFSQIVSDFNESYKIQVQAEQNVQVRNDVMRLFAGGDEAAAGEILGETTRNRERIARMEQLIAECGCDEETALMLQEQLQIMDQDQIRLQQMAELELADKGLFGWLWK